jgi:hypothetical protein
MKKTNIHLWLIRFIGLIVPRRLRADWRQEWEAELQYREEMLAEWDRLTWRNKLDICCGAARARSGMRWCCNRNDGRTR